MKLDPNKNYTICQYCNQTILANRFSRHILKVHKNDAPRIRHPELILPQKETKNLKRKILRGLVSRDRMKKVNEERRNSINRDSKEYHIIWDDIHFEKDFVRISAERIKDPLKPIPLIGSIKELNLIKKEYFYRLFGKELYKLTFYKGELLKEYSPDWKKIEDKIEAGREHFKMNLDSRAKRLRLGNELSVEDTLRDHRVLFEKSKYLQFLAKIQDQDFKIIPIIESSATKSESGFIFTIKSKSGKVLYFWESTETNRATHIFAVNQQSRKETLSIIESFICGKFFKRSLLHRNDDEFIKFKKWINFIDSIRHTDIISFKLRIKTILKTV